MRLERADRALVRWICGVLFRNRVSSSQLRSWLGLKGIDDLTTEMAQACCEMRG